MTRRREPEGRYSVEVLVVFKLSLIATRQDNAVKQKEQCTYTGLIQDTERETERERDRERDRERERQRETEREKKKKKTKKKKKNYFPF